MFSPQYISQQSMDLGVYLPNHIDDEDVLYYQSADRLMEQFPFDSTLSGHRIEMDSFDACINDQEALSTLSNDVQLTAISTDDPDITEIYCYFHEQSTVVPHIPKEIFLNDDKHEPSFDCKKFRFFDAITGRERRPLLHEFIRVLLDNEQYSHLIMYLDRKQGIFKLRNPKAIAELWKQVKARNSDNDMTYDKLARAFRHYYGKGIMISISGRFTFQFGPKSGFGTTWWPAC